MIRIAAQWSYLGLLHRWGDAVAVRSGQLTARLMGMSDSARARGILSRRAPQQQRFERIITAFGTGYAAGLQAASPAALAELLEEVDNSLRGFAYEGAGMALAVREAINPWRQPLLQSFLQGPAAPYTYLVHVGVGWAYGLVPGARGLSLELDPMLRCLALDGMGFREYFFANERERRAIEAQPCDATIAARLRDQGVGRCLWFVAAADPAAVDEVIGRFAMERRMDLWAGVGLAAVYAGEPPAADLAKLKQLAGAHGASLAQGAAFAAKALCRGGQMSEHHDVACRLLCGVSASEAARVTDEALVDLPAGDAAEVYQQWRQRIQTRLHSGQSGSVRAGSAYEYRHVVCFQDTNAVGNVYFASYVAWQGRVRELFLRDHVPEACAALKAETLTLVTRSASCRYIKELVAFDEVLIQLRSGPTVGGTMTLLFEYWKIPQAGSPERVATGKQVVRCLALSPDGTTKHSGIPAYFEERLQPFRT